MLEEMVRASAQRLKELQLIDKKQDDLAMEAVKDPTYENREEVLKGWLVYYKVFQGLKDKQRDDVVTSVLRWADSNLIEQRDLSSLDELSNEFDSLCSALPRILRKNGEPRKFTSLASKALWLCYPDKVPIFDDLASRALFVLSKLVEVDIPQVTDSEYKRFACIWRQMFAKYENELREICPEGYPYLVRVLDKILWILGEGRYGLQQPEAGLLAVRIR